jgi:hypothetical protein
VPAACIIGTTVLADDGSKARLVNLIRLVAAADILVLIALAVIIDYRYWQAEAQDRAILLE